MLDKTQLGFLTAGYASFPSYCSVAELLLCRSAVPRSAGGRLRHRLVMPTKRAPSAVRPALTLLSVTLTFFTLQTASFRRTHDEPLNLTSKSANFNYAVATHRNAHGNRCALLRCGPAGLPRSLLTTSCDRVEVTVKSSRANLSTRFCVVDYLHSHWDSLSRTYNEGLQFVASTVTLRHDTIHLPTEGAAMHVTLARNFHDISPSWLSFFPSNATRAVVRAWHRAIPAVPRTAPAPEQAALNRARNCRAADVVCHPRASAIRAHCDGLPRQTAAVCARGASRATWIAALLHALTLLGIVGVVADSLRGVVSRRRARALATLVGSGNISSIHARVVVFLLTTLILLAGVPRWPELVQTIARPFSVSTKHRLDPHHLPEATEFYGAVPDLRGRYEGYAYLMSDGSDRVRIAGPGTGAVVWIVGVALAAREAMEDGLIVRCLLLFGMAQVACTAFVGIAGASGKRRPEDDEYADRKSEEAFFKKGKERPRSFMMMRDRTGSLS